ncbi:hypothetical protein MP228_001269 [Amoeboaphelidium protococcarum]|nr:hypothetical protein MP228_001269 [Amoeboaphelidium protococcarum]
MNNNSNSNNNSGDSTDKSNRRNSGSGGSYYSDGRQQAQPLGDQPLPVNQSRGPQLQIFSSSYPAGLYGSSQQQQQSQIPQQYQGGRSYNQQQQFQQQHGGGGQQQYNQYRPPYQPHGQQQYQSGNRPPYRPQYYQQRRNQQAQFAAPGFYGQSGTQPQYYPQGQQQQQQFGDPMVQNAGQMYSGSLEQQFNQAMTFDQQQQQHAMSSLNTGRPQSHRQPALYQPQMQQQYQQQQQQMPGQRPAFNNQQGRNRLENVQFLWNQPSQPQQQDFQQFQDDPVYGSGDLGSQSQLQSNPLQQQQSRKGSDISGLNSTASAFTPLGTSSYTSLSNIDSGPSGARTTSGVTPDFSAVRHDSQYGGPGSGRINLSTIHQQQVQFGSNPSITPSSSFGVPQLNISSTFSSQPQLEKQQQAPVGKQISSDKSLQSQDSDSLHPTRPGFGIKGRKIKTKVNFFEFITIPGGDIHQYCCITEPTLPPNLSRKVFEATIRMIFQSKAAGGVKLSSGLQDVLKNLIYDGRQTVYSCAEIELDELASFLGDSVQKTDGSVSFDIFMVDENPIKFESVSFSEDAFKDTYHRKITITLESQGKIDMTELSSFVDGNTSNKAIALSPSSENSDGSSLPALRALDTLMRYRPSMLLTSIGRSFFSRNEVRPLGDGTECWLGYHQGIVAGRGKMMLNIDISATAFYEPGPLLVFVARLFGKKNVDDFARMTLRQREFEKADRMVRGIKIAVNHRGEMRRRYRIQGLTRTAADSTYFDFAENVSQDNKDGVATSRSISVAEYFASQYSVNLKYPQLPCVRVGNGSNHVYLPLECCDIVPGQRYMRKLNETQTAQMIKLTCQNPERRAVKISQSLEEMGISEQSVGGGGRYGSGGGAATKSKPAQSTAGQKLLNSEDAKFFSKYGIKLSSEMMTVPARVLEPPTLQYHPTSRDPLITPRDGSWNLRDKKVVQPATLHSWSIVCFGTPSDMPQGKIDLFLREMITTCRDTGLMITNPNPPALYGDPSGNIEAIMQAAWNAAGEAVQAYPQLIVCILPNTGVNLYSDIKRVGDTILGVPTQCIQVKHTLQPKKQYCANVCLKINAKLGGVNTFIVKNPMIKGDEGLPWVSDVSTMIVGADLTHPAHGESKTSGSVCALVGSLDRLASRYSASVRLQPARKEIILDLASMMQELLKEFYLENGSIAPQRILFYRDGVSDSQAHEVTLKEVQMIREACEALEPGYKPQITYVVVQKRHHTRVFTTNPKDADKSGNIPAGTVIDSHITHPNEYDFYLCSHAGLQGTSRPTHYRVLHDENKFTPDLIHELTYRLSYTYCRCTRSVSLVPCVYYADLLAQRARYHMRGQQNLSSQQSFAQGGPTNGSSHSGGDQLNLQQQQSLRERSSSSLEKVQDPDAAKQQIQRSSQSEMDAHMAKILSNSLVPVKPELSKVMYFM